MRLKISSDARDDLVDGFWFYENQRAGLGQYFRSSVIADIDSLYVYAGVHAIENGFHRKLCRTFPYTIYCKLETLNVVEIVAVLDQRLDPDSLRKRLEA